MVRIATLASLTLVSVVLAACGGGGGAADADPATAVPGNALFYLEATVRPEGELREDALAATGKILRTDDPEAKIRELIAEASEGEDFDYDRDVKPWLGDRAGLWVSDQPGDDGDPGVAAVVAASDLDAAENAIEKAREREGEKVTTRSHADVEYKVDKDGFAYAFAEDFVLFGDEPELQRTIDAVKGNSLAESDRYKAAIDGLEDERLAHFYADTRRFFEFAMKSDPSAAQSFEQLRSLIPFDRLPPAVGAFLADGSRLALDIGAEMPDESVRRRLGPLANVGGTPLLEELPADTWGAQGMPRFGESMRTLIDEFAGAFGGAVAQEQLKRQFGLDLQKDLLSWIGDVAFFVRGQRLAELDGGAVIQVTDENAAASAFGRIMGALRARGGLNARPARIDGAVTAFTVRSADLPKPVVIARGEGKVVVTYGEAAASEALSPAEKLGDSELFGRASDLLGDDLDPSFLLGIDPIVSLIDSSGEVDAEWRQAKPYVEAFDVVAIGGGSDDDRVRARIAAGLR